MYNAYEPILQKVQKPSRYTGGELNSTVKDWSKVKVRVALAFPDLYEIGFSHLGLRLLYHRINEEEDFWPSGSMPRRKIWKQNCGKPGFPSFLWRTAAVWPILIFWASPCSTS